MTDSIPHNPLMVVLKITAAKTTKLLTANFFVGEDAVKCGCKGKKMWLNDAIGEQ